MGEGVSPCHRKSPQGGRGLFKKNFTSTYHIWKKKPTFSRYAVSAGTLTRAKCRLRNWGEKLVPPYLTIKPDQGGEEINFFFFLKNLIKFTDAQSSQYLINIVYDN